MRRLGKRIVAITLAAAMMTSLTPQGMTFLQQEIVYAAEQSTNETTVWSSNADAILKFEASTDEKWKEKIFASNDGTNFPDAPKIENATVGTKVQLSAKVKIDSEYAKTLDESGNVTTGYKKLELKGIVKVGDSWKWCDSSVALLADDFQDGIATANFEINVPEENVGALQEIEFQYNIESGYTGTIEISDVTVVDIKEPSKPVEETREDLVYTCDTPVNTSFDFSNDEKENWDSTKLVLDISGSSVTIAENALLRGTVTIDQEAFDSLGEDGYIKVQTIMKLGEKSKWTEGNSYPSINKESLTANEDGTYSIEIEDEIPDTVGGSLKELFLRVAGKNSAGTISISNVKIYNVVSTDAPLPEKAPTVVDDFEEDAIGSNAEWSNEVGWQYGQEVKPIVVNANDSNMLELKLDYTDCEGFDWSEAKIHKDFEDGLDISAYNLITYDLIYKKEFDGQFKAKVFASNAAGKEIFGKIVQSFETTDLGNGMMKATITAKFSPSTEKIAGITIGTVGVNTNYVGSVYIDNITLSQYDASADFVEITSVADNDKARTEAVDTEGMATTVSLADKDASAATKALYAYLKKVDENNQVLFGHQNDTHKSVNPEAAGRSDSKDITNSISGVVGIDSLALTGAEIGETDTAKAVTKCIEISNAAANDGAILTLSTHMPNMSNEKIVEKADGSFNFSACDFAESKDLNNMENNGAKEVLPGGKYNAKFTAYLDIIAEYAQGLGDTPVLFRPFHEGDGGWFWWGNATTDNETYKALYRYTEDYLTSKGVHNFIYVYSPCGPANAATYEDRYPGDEYVDVLSFDYYDDYSSADAEYSDEFFTNLEAACKDIYALAQQKGKVAAIAEAGVRVMKADGSDQEGILVKNNPIKGQNWYKKINDVAADTGMSYFLLWANFSDTNFYIPYKYNETKGQELINEFIDFYNEESSIFADGTNFYGNASKQTVENSNKGEAATGYITNVASKDTIKDSKEIKANVKNANEVKFVLKNGSISKDIVAEKVGETNEYKATITSVILDELGKTDAGTIELVADGQTIATLKYISFGQEKTKLPENVIENFDLYFGDDAYLGGSFSSNSGAGCSSSMKLNAENAQGEGYAGAFTYSISGNGGYTGQCKSGNYDFSEYNALQMWINPDGQGQKLIIQLTSGDGEYEVDLTKIAQSTKSGLVTIPFSSFEKKVTKDPLSPSKVTKFAIYCNKIDKDLTSTIYFDDIEAVSLTDEELAKANENGGLIIAYDNNGESSSGSTGSGNTVVTNPDGSTSTTTTTTKPDGSTVETVTTTKPDGTSTIVVSEQEKNEAGKTVEVTTTTEKDAEGNVTGTTEKSVIADVAKNTSATVTVTTDNNNNVTATAEVTKEGIKVPSGTRGTIAASVIAQITEAAGTTDVTITQTVTDSKGKELYTVTMNASDAKAGTSLTIVKLDEKTGEYVLVNKKEYPVTKAGNVVMTIKNSGDYKLISKADATALIKKILKTVKPAASSKTVKKGKSTTFTFSKSLNMKNVAKITYVSSNSSVAKVSKTGKITAKKDGTVTIKAKVTLKDGSTKTVSMKIKVK